MRCEAGGHPEALSAEGAEVLDSRSRPLRSRGSLRVTSHLRLTSYVLPPTSHPLPPSLPRPAHRLPLTAYPHQPTYISTASMATPVLTPVAPTRGAAQPITASPTWIGSASNCHLQLQLPGVADHHLALLEREDGWWASEGKGRTSINGQPLSGTRLLADGDVIDIVAGCRYEFSSGVPRAQRRAEEPAEVAVKIAKPRRVHRPGGGRAWGPYVAVAALLLLLGIGGYALYVALVKAEKSPEILTDQQAELFDRLLVEAYLYGDRKSVV